MQRRGDGWIATGWLALLALLFAGWLAVAPLPAQFGDLVGDFLELDGNMLWNGVEIDAVNTGDADNRSWFRGDGQWTGVGLADAASDLVTATTSTMMATYQTIMSATVDVDEQGDRVLVDVTAQLGWMGAGLFIASTTGLWELDSLDASPSSASFLGAFPAGITNQVGAIAIHGGVLYIGAIGGGDAMWSIADPTAPGSAVNRGAFPGGINWNVSGLTSHMGVLYATNASSLLRIPDPTDVTTGINEGNYPANPGSNVASIASDGVALYMVTNTGQLWRLDNPTNPGSAVMVGTLVGGGSGADITGGVMYFASNDELFRLDDLAAPAEAFSRGEFAAAVGSVRGVVSRGDAPCDIRIARGTTDVEEFSFQQGRIWLDATFVDQPAAGAHTYSLQHKTSSPNTMCTAYRGGRVRADAGDAGDGVLRVVT